MVKIFGKKVEETGNNQGEFLTKTIIGLGYGLIKTRDLILNKELGISTQDAMDALSLWVGRELMKDMLDKKIVKVTDSDQKLINGLTTILNIADELDIEVTEDKIKLVVQKCLICPKRIGGYDLEGNTSCPVGGLLTGALSYARGTDPMITKNRLQTGEICHIELDL